jgi:phosphoribosyl-AMP cyclohydrolase
MKKIDIEHGNTLVLDFEKLKKISSLKEKLVPVIVQDLLSKDVLLLGYTNKKALELTLKTGQVTLWSTSRNELWVKGATSGDYLDIIEVRINCEQNTLLYLVLMKSKSACHVKDNNNKHYKSCFYRRLSSKKLSEIL